MKIRPFINCAELRIGTNIRIMNVESRVFVIRRLVCFIRNSMKYIIPLLLAPQLLWSQQVIEKEITDWEFRMVGDSVWKKAKVPGTIIDNFANLNNISDPQHPYYGDNEKLYQWIGEKDWEFRTTIHLPVEYWEKEFGIQFGSLDLFADIFINDEWQCNHSNAFI